MSEAGDVKSTGREDAKEQLANAGGPVVGISWHRSVIVFSRAFCWQLQLFGQDNLRRNSFFLSLSLFVSLFRSILRPTGLRN